jgi:hypothetical protein
MNSENLVLMVHKVILLLRVYSVLIVHKVRELCELWELSLHWFTKLFYFSEVLIVHKIRELCELWELQFLYFIKLLSILRVHKVFVFHKVLIVLIIHKVLIVLTVFSSGFSVLDNSKIEFWQREVKDIDQTIQTHITFMIISQIAAENESF